MRVLKKIYAALDFLVFYLVKLISANLQIAYDILTPRMHTSPGFIRIPLHIRSDTGLLLFSNLLSMTPGTLTMDIDSERRSILVHVLYSEDEQKIRSEIQLIQEKVKRLSR